MLGYGHKVILWAGDKSIAIEVISKPISGVIFNQPRVEVRKKLPPFAKGGEEGLNNLLIIPLNTPLGKGDLKTSVIVQAASPSKVATGKREGAS